MLAPPSTTTKLCKYGHAAGRNAQGRCRECMRIRARKRYAKDLKKSREKERIRHRLKRGPSRRAYERKHYAANPQRYMLKNAVSRAKQCGLVCTITEKDILIPKFCPLLGLELERGVGKQQAASPSLDRVRPELGYAPGNVWVISHRANELKRDATLTELRTLVKNLAKRMR